MSTFWLKVAAFAVVILTLVILVNVFSPSKPSEPVEPEPVVESEAVEQPRIADEGDVPPQPEVEQQSRQRETATRRRSRREMAEQIEAAERAAKSAKPSQPETLEDEQIDIMADRLYQMAVVESKIARKPMMTYKRMVDYCRQILERYPNSRQAPMARKLLREMPKRARKRYNVTDEEMGL